MTTLDYQRVYTIMMWYEYRIVEVYFCIYTVDLIRLSSYRGVPMATVRCWETVAVVTGGMVVMNLAVTGWLVGHKKMYWLVVDLPLYMEIYGSVYSHYIENKIYVLQWIGFVGKIYWFKPHISWENLWFPVQIFPTKPIQKDVLFNPDWGDDLKKDSLKYSHQFQASATGSGFIYKYDIYISFFWIKIWSWFQPPWGHHDIHIIASQLAQQLPRLARPGTSSRIHRSTGPSNVCARRAVKGWRKVGPGDSVGHLLSSG